MSYSIKGWNLVASTAGPFSFDFPYLSRADLIISVNGVAQSGVTFPTPYSFMLASPANPDDYVEVRRRTNRTARLVNFQNTSGVTEYELDLSADQCFMIAQEAFDELALSSVKAVEDGTLAAAGRRISGVADPVNPQDVVTKAHGDALYGGAVSGAAIAARDAAIAAAEDAEASAVDAAASAAAVSAAGYIKADGTVPFTNGPVVGYETPRFSFKHPTANGWNLISAADGALYLQPSSPNTTDDNAVAGVRFINGGGLELRNAGALLNLQASGSLRTAGHISRYESSAWGLRTTVGVVGTQAHGGSRPPDAIKVLLRCVTTDAGYAVGDEVEPLKYLSSTAYVGLYAYCSDTTVGVLQTHTAVAVPHKTTAVPAACAVANWSVVVRCIWL